MIDNPDPKRYVVKIRRGKAVLVDKQVLRWQKYRKRKGELGAKPKQTAKETVDGSSAQITEDRLERIKKLFIGS